MVAPGAGWVAVVPGAGAAGVVTVGVTVVGGWTSGSDFSPHPVAARVADAATTRIGECSRLPPRFDPESTGSKLASSGYSTTTVPAILVGWRVQT